MRGYAALLGRELKKWYQQPFNLFMGVVQPIVWMALFGKALAARGAVLSGDEDYFSYMAAGMPSFVVLFTSVFSGMSIVWDRRLGFLSKVLSTPVSRGAVVLSKMTAAVVRSLALVVAILLVAFLLGLDVGAGFTWYSLPIMLFGLGLMGFGLAALLVSVAVRSTKWETQMALVNLLNLPLLFASNTLYPISAMPEWLQVVAHGNPVSYATDLSRQMLLDGPRWEAVLVDLGFLGAFAALFAGVGIWTSWRYLSK